MEYVNLGLPSGTLWAKCNLGAEKETDFGLYYQWGDTQGYEDANGYQFGWNDYKWGTSWDNMTKYNNLDNKLILDNEDDPVFAVTNGKFKSPTKEQLQELIDHTDHEWTAIDGVNGMKFTNKKDSFKYIFIPAAGYCSYGSHRGVGSSSYVWSAYHDGEDYVWYMCFNVGDVGMCGDHFRCDGQSVRGVVVPQAETFDEIDDTDDGQPVDLGLPSGTKWMKSNIGATKPSDFGEFFQWGDTQGYSGVKEHQFGWSDYKWGIYKSLTKYNNTDQLTLLEPSDDAATGGGASMPTKDQLQELIDNTEHRWLSLANGVNGMKFWKKGTDEPIDGNPYIFIPAAGNCGNGSRYGVGSWGSVWSASRNESFANDAWDMFFDADDVVMYDGYRCVGCSVREVVVPQAETFDEIDDTDDGQPVDLGLPSGTKWMKSNIGATKPSDFGEFFQWGDTQGYSGVDEHQFNWDDYKWGSYKSLTKYNENDTKLILDDEDDPVYAATNGQASMPTKAQLEELVNNTEHRWLSLANGVNGTKFWKKDTEEPTDGNSYIFIPAAGNCNGSNHLNVGSWGYVWSSSRDESYADDAWGMGFGAGHVTMGYGFRWLGYSVRGVINSKNI